MNLIALATSRQHVIPGGIAIWLALGQRLAVLIQESAHAHIALGQTVQTRAVPFGLRKTKRRSSRYLVTYPTLNPSTAPASRALSVPQISHAAVSLTQKIAVVTTPMSE